jgi:hypothetical protein
VADDTQSIHARVSRISGEVPAWLHPHDPENRIPVAVAIVVAIGLQYSIPSRYGLQPRWLIPSLEVVLLVVLVAMNPVRLVRAAREARVVGFLMVAAITVDNAFSAGILDRDILTGRTSNNAAALMFGGAAVYLTNIVAFGIWYWELDRGGPIARSAGTNRYPDLLFPQMTSPNLAPPHWRPQFLDYLYTSLTNVFAFSPTDTLPASRWAKMLFAVQSAIALSTTALVIARAVNVLK